MMKADVKMRTAAGKGGKWDPEMDKRHAKVLVKIVNEFGWPTYKLVGRKGSIAAWLILQHADYNLAFQKKCLKLLQKAVKEKQADKGSLAFLTDRVLVNSGKKQVYGTQFYAPKGIFIARPIADRKGLDARRKSAKLGSFAKYEKLMATVNKRWKYEPLLVKKSKTAGKGVFANRDFKKGEVIFRYTGKLMTNVQMMREPQSVRPHSAQISETLWIGPAHDVEDFVNHSCNPNAGQKIHGKTASLIAIKYIKSGEEITYDYSTAIADNETMKCACGNKKCRKTIASFGTLTKALQKKYIQLGVVPPFIIERQKMQLYRFTTNGEGVFSAGKRLLPETLINEVLERKKWLVKPTLPKGKYRFYLTKKGKATYEKTLLLSHKKYLSNIKSEASSKDALGKIVYEDENQVVEKL